MSNEIQKSDLDDEKKIDILRKTICNGLNNEELGLFLHVCKRSGLDPFSRQIHPVKRGGKGGEKMTIQTGIDGYRLIAERTGRYMPGKPYSFEYRNGSQVHSATAYVKKMDSKGDWHEIAHTVYMDEYMVSYNGQPSNMWKTKPHVMLGKCAEAAVLRKAFPADLSGLYTQEEMQQADNTTDRIPSKQVEEAPETIEIVESAPVEKAADPTEQLISAENAKMLDDVLVPFPEILSRILKAYKIERMAQLKEKDFPVVKARLDEIFNEMDNK